METTEHITESYVRYIKNWLTISNIKCANGNEIDIIAYDPSGNDFYHIECGVTFMNNFCLKSMPDSGEYDKKTGKYKRHNSVDYFVEKKFENKNVKNKLNELNFKKVKRIIVCWRVKNEEVYRYAKEKNIEIWEMKKFLHDLSIDLAVDTKYYTDDIIRTIQLIKKI